jgi:stage II sporulation protein D
MAAGSRVIKSTNFTIAGASAAAAPQPPAASDAAPEAAPAPKPSAANAAPGFKTDPMIEMTRSGIFTTKELMEMLLDPSKKDEYLRIGYERMKGRPDTPQAKPAPAPARVPASVPAAAGGDFVFVGKGWGHGVGLSQWGAKAMADRGMKCGEILAHYFPGTKIGR